MNAIPVSAVVVTKNEERNIRRCLEVLNGFGEVIVVDSASSDKTQDIASECGAAVVNFEWDGRYPKKRQWCLDTLELKHEWVFFVDADEVLTPDLVQEMAALFKSEPSCAGYFVKGQYVWRDKLLRHGQRNNKLCLLDRSRMMFPIVDDLDMPGMGEIEGHYQPVLKNTYRGGAIGQLHNPLLHYAYENEQGWAARHERYADWEVAMTQKQAWPDEVKPLRSLLKKLFRLTPLQPILAFLYSYVLRLGMLDGGAGFDFARSRLRYYKMIRERS